MAPRRPALAALAAFALLVLLAGCSGPGKPPAAALDPASRRELPAGVVVGSTGVYGSHAWRGIPYAEPPVGERRWRAPRPLARFPEPRDALVSGSPCTQYASVYAGEPRDKRGVVGSEDCLSLDVYAPRFEPAEVPGAGARLPVMVWIHGGGNTIGSARLYDGGNLAARQRVVVVVIQYRLGPLGWFRHASLRAEGGSADDRSGNFGTLDTIRALEWVRENAAAFGGDPGNVTLFGESAGGNNVFALLVSPRAKGLFQKAILQSPSLDTEEPAGVENFTDDAVPGERNSSSEALLRLLRADGSAADRAAARTRLAAMAPAEQAAYLRGKRAEELLAAYREDSFEGMYDAPNLFREGRVLPAEEPEALLARGAYQQLPVIFGTNRDENKIFMAFDPTLTRWWLGILPRAHDPERYAAYAEHQAAAWKWRSVDRPAALARKLQGPSVYAYRFDWDEEPRIPLLIDGPALVGAAHGLEIPFVFGHFDLGPESSRLFTRWNREGREALSAQMMSYWAEFAYRGAPGRGRGGDLPEWRAWDDATPTAPKYLVLDTPAGGGLHAAFETVPIEQVVARIAADPRLDTPREKCALMRRLADWDYISRGTYASANASQCARYALEAYPWTDVATGE